MNPLKPFEISFSGINLVEASAGTGKTYNIASLYIRALIEQDIPVRKILVVTYTEAATKELKDRLLKRIRESIIVLKTDRVSDENDEFLTKLLDHVDDKQQAIKRLDQAVRTFDEAAIYTIHGFCYQALQEQAFESGAGYGAEITADDSELVLEAVDDFWRSWVGEADDSLKRPLLKFLLERGYSPDTLAEEMGSYIGQPFLEVHPRQTPAMDEILEKVADLNKVYEEMKSCWEGEEQSILSLFGAERMNGNSYPRKPIDDWTEKMADFLNPKVPSIALFDKFDKFTPDGLNDGLRKDWTEIPRHPFFELASRYRDISEDLRDFDIVFKKQLLQYLRKEVRAKKEDLQLLSYDDLLLQLQKALKDVHKGQHLAGQLRQKYPLALVDEFQDTDPSQYDIFRRIYSREPDYSALFMIGDPKQSIYSFRGADVFSYLKARQDAPEDHIYSLARNFRSTPGLIKGINALFGRHPNPFVLEQISFEEVRRGRDEKSYDRLIEYGDENPAIRFRHLTPDDSKKFNKGTAADKAALDTAREISRLINGGKNGDITIGSDPVKAKDIAVLVRTHRQAQMMSDVLQERGIKSVQYSQDSVFDSEEARLLEIFLKAVADPGNESLVKTALSLPLTSFSANELLDIEEEEKRWVNILDRFSKWHRQWQQQGFATMFRSVLKEAEISEQLMTYSDGERRVTNVLHLGELLQAEARQQKEGIRGLFKWLARKRKEGDAKQDEEQLRLESDQELIKIVTLHRSKGLEYSVVFCPFLWYGPRYQDKGKPLVYHDPEKPENVYLDLNGRNDFARGYKRWLVAREELAESLRLAYVAITRAKQCCYLTWAYAPKSEFSALGYLLSDPKQALKNLKQTITEKYQAAGAKLMDQSIMRLCDDYPKLFMMTQESQFESQQLELLNGNEQSKLAARLFRGREPIEPGYHVSSFSSLTSWMDEDPDIPDYDQYMDGATRETISQPKNEEMTMFTFPRGPQPGTCIHKIFEDTDFSNIDGLEEQIDESLIAYGIDPEWDTVVADMLKTTLKIPLLESEQELTLGSLKTNDFIPELEFYYRNEDIESEDLISIIRKNDSQYEGRGHAASGFMKGFIDLTFRHGDRFYLLDYKTNYLGDSYDDYCFEKLQLEMYEASYDLQYHIYTIALHRFLKSRFPGYSYEENFGGAFYLFLRGINSRGREGIFFDRPDVEIIDELNRYVEGADRDG